MPTPHNSGATTAPSPKILQHARLVAAGEAPWMASALAMIAYPVDRRDDVSALASLTASRCAAAGVSN